MIQSCPSKDVVFSDWDGERGEVQLEDQLGGILGNLACNIMLNSARRGGVSVRRINWFDALVDRSRWEEYDVVIGSDLLYEDAAVVPLLETVRKSLTEGGKFYLFAPASKELSR